MITQLPKKGPLDVSGYAEEKKHNQRGSVGRLLAEWLRSVSWTEKGRGEYLPLWFSEEEKIQESD